MAANLRWSTGRWVAHVETERTGFVDAHGPTPLAAMASLVDTLVSELDDRDLKLEEAKESRAVVQ